MFRVRAITHCIFLLCIRRRPPRRTRRRQRRTRRRRTRTSQPQPPQSQTRRRRARRRARPRTSERAAADSALFCFLVQLDVLVVQSVYLWLFFSSLLRCCVFAFALFFVLFVIHSSN